MNRRNFVGLLPGLAVVLSSQKLLSKNSESLPISANEYNWVTFYNRSGKEWGKDWDACLGEFAKTKIPGFEPSIRDAAHLKELIPSLEKHQIQVPSIYVGSLMHGDDLAQKSTKQILEIAQKAKPLGTKIIVTNPNPIQWGSGQLKNDRQLLCQSSHLDKLGQSLKTMGITLAYHTHDVELQAGAREFHHVLQNTSPENLAFCMDVHWIYRGSGNSQVAVFDTLKMYGERIVSFHLRQSQNGVWSETFHPEGDIDCIRFAKEIKKMGINAHLVIEQCLEEKTVQKTDVIEAHKISYAAINKLFNS
ncbi:TIM barrel protein [Aquiflexum sp. TKW24L]|uniref:sugar phosphate isomerase/epimerase family protein n=1 Tax=Aquiflexum sp. TKW24L TaxID=2942212 RepID=UPI0020C01A85|nr:TIM barrel protein [Aquiflexum sp. TKW24L]MCL6258834.1 TIM barrel protein [Aquiflexum sp. TKW24L]